MAKINILDSKIYNKIAAGEVVERPASVVKELLDNSIDAGADDIKIEIAGGGLKSITVKDNGCGIEKEDVKNAFLAHATSKIASEKDLYGIKTLGFRGEALASIAAVSMVSIKTMTKGALSGISISLKGGEVTGESECGMDTGTVITAENLFFNTPARLKFLKSERSEEAEITNIISRYILSNPGIRIKYTANGKVIYQSVGKGLNEAVNCIYGNEALNNVIEIDSAYNGFKVYGYIGKTSYTKPNRTYQTLAVNKRYVINSTVSAAITAAYGSFLMKRQYPFYVLHIQIPDNFVDVNVHPNKLDVRFEDNKKIFNLIYQPVYGRLYGSAININISDTYDKGINNDNQNAVNPENKEQGGTKEQYGGFISEILNKYDNKDREISLTDLKTGDIYNTGIENKYKAGNNSNDNKVNIIKPENEILTEKANNVNVTENIVEQKTFKEICYDIKCVLFDTYIVLEYSDGILLVDQHAAHERILYDKFRGLSLKGENAVQDLLVPYIFCVNSGEYDYLCENLEALKAIGFNTEIFGSLVFKVSSVPAALSGIDLERFFSGLLKDLNSLRQINAAEALKETLIKKACRAAVKAGDTLDKSEIDMILDKLFDNTVLLCPHGRPVAVKYTKTEIEKLFKRVL